MKTLDAVSGLWHPWLSFRKPTFKVWEKSELAVRSMLGGLRPRFSLLSGAAFVLVTLFLPVAYNACGPAKTGAEFVGGASGEFPLLTGLPCEGFGRGFYTLALVFAVITLGIVLLSVVRPGMTPGRKWITALCATAGTFSLYLLADAICWMAGGLVLVILEAMNLSSRASMATAAGLVLVLIVVCLSSRLLRNSRVVYGLLAAGTIGCSLLLEFYLVNLPAGFPPDFAVNGLFYFLAALYWFVPAYLWYRFGLRRSSEPSHWPSIRRAILKIYLPAFGCIPIFFCFAWDEGVWGFIPFSVGIHLMSLGYMRLVQRQTNEVMPVGVEASS
jgi:hypothetical protein